MAFSRVSKWLTGTHGKDWWTQSDFETPLIYFLFIIVVSGFLLDELSPTILYENSTPPLTTFYHDPIIFHDPHYFPPHAPREPRFDPVFTTYVLPCKHRRERMITDEVTLRTLRFFSPINYENKTRPNCIVRPTTPERTHCPKGLSKTWIVTLVMRCRSLTHCFR